MHSLNVSIEINGKQKKIGRLTGNNHQDAAFQYDADYLADLHARPISISLPLQEKPFTPQQTKNFFEGLLPEGFSRRAVANWVRVPEDDYLSILEKLGSECLGAIQIWKEGDEPKEDKYRLLSLDEVHQLAAEGATKSTEILMETHLSLTGASGKAGLYYDEKSGKWYLPIGNAASTHIVKQSHVRLQRIVSNEQFCMNVAKKLGILIPDTFIVNLGSGEEDEVLLASKRYDRRMSKMSIGENSLFVPYRLHQEDFCQALGLSAADKYETTKRSYLKRMFDLVRAYSSNPIEDQLRLWDMIIINYLLGNTDAHLKNYSFIYSEDLTTLRLAPAYDIVCTLYYGTTKEMSVFIGGESDINKINRDSFISAAEEAGLGIKIAMKHLDKLSADLTRAINETTLEMTSVGYVGIEAISEFLKSRAKVILK